MLALFLLNGLGLKRHRPSLSQPRKTQNCQKSPKIENKEPEMFYCRTCLSTNDLEAIFYSRETEKKRSDDLKLVTGLEIKMDDGLSQKICNRCLKTMNMALQFRRTSRKAEKALLSMAARAKTRKKYTTKIISKSKTIRTPKKIKVDKIEEKQLEKVEEDYNYDAFFDDFQNHDYDISEPILKEEESKPKAKEFSKKATVGRKKRTVIPNAASYKCSTCNKEFRMKATYKAHMRFHTNYCVCEACGKRCRNNNQLQEHKRARHGLGRIHKCAYCEYSSATKEALTIHERRHTGERPYICDHCGASFHRRSNLVQHIAIHLPEKNFQCDMCPKRLKSRKFLQIHKHNAHTGKRYGYLCPICEHRFEKPNKVRAHTRRVHGVPDEQQGPIVRVQL